MESKADQSQERDGAGDWKRKGKFRQKRENVKKSRLIIRNLSYKATEDLLKNEFQTYGAISEVNLLKKPDGKLVGCAFIQYENYQDSVSAIKKMNGKDFMKRKITVDFAVSKNRYKAAHPEDVEVKEEIKKEEVEVKADDDGIKEEETDPENDDEDNPSDDSGSDENEDEDEDETDENNLSISEIAEAPVKQSRNNPEDHDYTVFIKNLSFDTTNEDLQECFKKYGPIKYALVVKDPVSGHSKGSGFVKFLKKESVNMCMQQTGLVTLKNVTLEIYPSLPKQKIQSLETTNKQKEQKDSRNMYLLREGMVMAGSSAAEGVSAGDMAQRLRLEQIKTQMLKNLNRFISRDRLTVHNLPPTYDDVKLRKMVIARTGIKPLEAKIMRENKPSSTDPTGKSKGFGFMSFKKHEDALTVFRKLNNNPDIFSANHRPIVSFSIEDKNVLNIKERRKLRSKLNNPTYQKKMEKLKLKKKAKKLLDKKDKKDKKSSVVVAAKSKSVEVDENSGEYSGFAAKPGPFVKMRGTGKLKEQSKIHEKSMQERNKKVRREKQMNEIRQEKAEKKLDKTKKRKIENSNQDNLTKMINKYKNMIRGDGESNEKRVKTRGKWFMDS